MSTQQLNPPRQVWETAEYEDDPFDLGDIDENRFKIVEKDFLPKPEELVFKQPTRSIKIMLDQISLDFFQKQAQEQNISFQELIQTLLTNYVKRKQK